MDGPMTLDLDTRPDVCLLNCPLVTKNNFSSVQAKVALI